MKDGLYQKIKKMKDGILEKKVKLADKKPGF